MFIWTVLDSCGLILDRTEGPGLTALHPAQNPLASVQLNIPRALFRAAALNLRQRQETCVAGNKFWGY
jgi:hypothetical protein